jgi:glutaredoxin 3
MKPVEIYTTPTCGFCHAAKRLLKQKSINFIEIDVSRSPGKRNAMTQRAKGGRTVPQIFIGGEHIGGCDQLYALEHRGKLDPMLKD